MMSSMYVTWMMGRRKVLIISVCFAIFLFVTFPIIFNISQIATSFALGNASTRDSFVMYPEEAGSIPLRFNLRKRLSPLASITQRLAFADPPLSKAEIGELYKCGAGLEKLSLDGVDTWREYGVTYIPHNMSTYARSTLAQVEYAEYDPYIPYNHSMFFEGRDHKRVPDSEKKIILARFAGMDNIRKTQPLKVCPEFPCVQANNFDKYYKLASAVTFNVIRLKGKAPQRRPEQIFIFYNYEPLDPSWGSNLSIQKTENGWSDAFNWTMSYHTDADIFMPYGLTRRRRSPVVKDYASILAHKSKLVVAFISHCPTFSKREEYLMQLQKYIPVEVYGSCGPYKCPREKNCFNNVSTEYLFYLSFENALCEDYITEKFFKSLKMDTVLVARGGGSYYRHVPNDIYINTADFNSPEALAQRLLYLSKHDDEYAAILRRKDEYFTSHENYPHLMGKTVWVKYNYENAPLCEVCQRLWNIDLYSNVYPDIRKWFNDHMCVVPKDV